MRVKLDESVLKKIADITLADYYRATNASDLKKVYAALATTIRLEKHQTTEVTALFLAMGALLILLAGFLSLRRDARVL
jgi:Ca-activated chloride channel family protein